MTPRPVPDPHRNNTTLPHWQESRIGAALFALAAVIIPVLCLSSNSPLYSAIGGTLLMLVINLLLPACRPRRPYASPYNWAFALFVLELVVVPANMMVAGVKPATLPFLPSATSIEYAYLLTALGYLCFSLSYGLTSRRRKRTVHAPMRWTMSKSGALIYVVIGFLGLVFAFSDRSVSDYYVRAAGRIVDPSLSTTLAGAASTFLRPFLAFGAVALWSRWVDTKAMSRVSLILAGVVCACITAVVFSTYGYNRAVIAAPLVCITAVIDRHIRKVPLSFLICAGSALLLVLVFVGQYRGTRLGVEELLNEEGTASRLIRKSDFSEQLQLYSGGPQFTAYLLEVSQFGQNISLGQTFGATLLSPVPVLGKAFRPSSGPVLYNNLIYGNSTTLDQPIPFAGEVFINFHILGIIVGYALLGRWIRRLQNGFENTAGSLKTFSFLYIAIWLCYTIHSSALVVSQMLIYFCLPIYGVMLVSSLRNRHRKVVLGLAVISGRKVQSLAIRWD